MRLTKWRPQGAMWRSWSNMPRALHYLKPYRGSAVVAIALTVVLAVVALAEPWPLALIVDGVLSDRDPPTWISSVVGTGATELILFAVAASLVLTLVSGGVTVLSELVTTRVNERMVLDLRSEMFQHAQRLSLGYHDSTSTGGLMYQINNQADAVGAVVVALPPVLQSLFTLVGMVWIAIRIDAQLALLAMSVVPLIWYSTHFYGNHVEPRLYHVRNLEGRNLSIVHEAMAMLRVVVAFGREDHEYRRFRKQGEETVDARVKLTVRQTIFKLAVSFITAVGTAVVLGVGAHKVLNGSISGGQLLVVLAYVAQVYAPLELLTNSLTQFQENFIALEHSFQLLDTPAEVQESPDAVAIDGVRTGIQLHDVAFSYSARTDTLKGISFEVPAGHAVAIVGPTGAGKSTLVSLLPRFYDPAQGKICIDGLDLRDITLVSLRAQFSIVLQEPLLFSGTIGDNIGYGRLGATQEEIEEAAKAANAHDFISQLPQGYDTSLGERGAKISGGERQRIAVARAFLRDAPILILDEPTSSIDSRTETVILDALEKLMEGRTTIMIAHRLSTVRGVDQILVLDGGEIVQRGNHDELLEQDGLYRHLWEAQTRVRGPRRFRDTGGDQATVSDLDLADAVAGAGGQGSHRNGHESRAGTAMADVGAAVVGEAGGEQPVTSGESTGKLRGSSDTNRDRNPPFARKVDLNSANIVQVLSAPGIGPTLARAIMARREELGSFERLEDLLEIPGVGEARLHSLRPHFEVGRVKASS